MIALNPMRLANFQKWFGRNQTIETLSFAVHSMTLWFLNVNHNGVFTLCQTPVVAVCKHPLEAVGGFGLARARSLCPAGLRQISFAISQTAQVSPKFVFLL
jgi:hypothetical protein